MSTPSSFFRIHGDNIIECERGLEILKEIFVADVRMRPSLPFQPRFIVTPAVGAAFDVELLPGHGRGGVNLQQWLRDHGAPLREATDVLLTRLSSDGTAEAMVAALEFCSALPAGNNAWQRNGRALACVAVGLPYLYFAEIGGVELGADRKVKAPRFPNPLVPFSYLTATREYDVVCLPVYGPSPSSTAAIREIFSAAFAEEQGRNLLKAVIEGREPAEARREIELRALKAIEILAAQRQRTDTLRGSEWQDFLLQGDAAAKAVWLERRNMSWVRKAAEKVPVSRTFNRLVALVEKAGSVAVGASGVPICLLPSASLRAFAGKLARLYRGALDDEFLRWLSDDPHPLVIVWVTGFKPRGDDSRPDRGLVPLARMLFGDEARILTVVSGPGKREMWRKFRRAPGEVAAENGLWEAVYNLSDAILADSKTMDDGAHALLTRRAATQGRAVIAFPAAKVPVRFSEQDVDSVLHLLFSQTRTGRMAEAMCNPPGGDWSGVTLRDFATGAGYRWTSLPRVSGKDGKRPDHAAQVRMPASGVTLLIIESKDTGSKLEEKIGPRMKKFMAELLATPPTIFRAAAAGVWLPYLGKSVQHFTATLTAGGFCWKDADDLMRALQRGQLDLALAFEFRSGEEASLLHIARRPCADFLLPILREAAEIFGGRLEVHVY